jgi:Leucine-rich repeat (LRR) protein
MKNKLYYESSDRELQQLPSYLIEDNVIENLELKYNNFEEFPKEIEKLTKLKKLTYCANSTNGIEVILKMKNLTYLDLSQMTLSPEFIKSIYTNLTNLEELYLYEVIPDNQIADEIINLKKLKSLVYESAVDEITYISNNIYTLTNLEELGINYGGDTPYNIPDDIFKLKNLKDFYFCGTLTDESMEKIYQLHNLEKLTLHYNDNLTHISKKINDLKNLKSLDIYFNKNLQSIPETFSPNLNIIYRTHANYCDPIEKLYFHKIFHLQKSKCPEIKVNI